MIVTIVGKRSLGKSTLALYLSRRTGHVIAFDPRNQFPVTEAALVTYGDLPEPDLFGYLDDPSSRMIVIRPAGDLQAASDRLSAEVTEYLADRPTVSLAIILDDAGTLDHLKNWNRLLRTADRDRVWFLFTVHRPVDVPVIVRSLADWWIVFRTTEDNDLKVIAERCGKDFAEQCKTLKPREWLLWDDTTSDEKQQIKFFGDPKAWHVPLDRPSVASDRSGDAILPEPMIPRHAPRTMFDA